MSTRFSVVALLSALLFFSFSFKGDAQNFITIPDSPKPSVEQMLAGLSSYNFSKTDFAGDTEKNEKVDFLEYYILVQLEKYMGAICPNARFGTDYARPSTEHARINFTYSYKTHTAFDGHLYWDCHDLKIIFNVGLGHYKYIFTIPKFSVIGNSFPDTLYKLLRNSISQKVHHFNAHNAPTLLKIKTNFTESSLRKELLEKGADSYEGIYEDIASDNGKRANKYKLAVKNIDGEICLIYLSGANLYDDWEEGEVKALLTPTASSGVFKASWISHDKYKDESAYISFKSDCFLLNCDEGNTTFIKLFPIGEYNQNAGKISEWSGTGFALKNGYIATNYHVVEGAKSIEIHGVKGDASSNYTATVVATDKNNDLAIIQITDSRFEGFGTVPYAIKNQMAEVGEDIWVLGYPLTQILGNEIKLTTGVVSSRSGFQGDVSTYQISAPVQPGNSGGPLFDSKGNIVGIVNAGVPIAENVGYAIKTSYLFILAESFASKNIIPSTNSISDLSRPEQIKSMRNFVFMLKCSSTPGYSSSSISSNSYSWNGPSNSMTANTMPSYIGSSKIIPECLIKNKEQAQLKVGDGSVIKWESDDETIATISSNGLVLGQSEGRTAIWAHLSDGSVRLFRIIVSNVPKNQQLKPSSKVISSTPNTIKKKISGTVRSSLHNAALMGVLVTVEGKNELAVTNSKGQYSIQVSNGDTLIFSDRHHNPVSIKVGENETIDITMSPK